MITRDHTKSVVFQCALLKELKHTGGNESDVAKTGATLSHTLITPKESYECFSQSASLELRHSFGSREACEWTRRSVSVRVCLAEWLMEKGGDRMRDEEEVPVNITSFITPFLSSLPFLTPQHPHELFVRAMTKEHALTQKARLVHFICPQPCRSPVLLCRNHHDSVSVSAYSRARGVCLCVFAQLQRTQTQCV